jgi:hypothetical protein
MIFDSIADPHLFFADLDPDLAKILNPYPDTDEDSDRS